MGSGPSVQVAQQGHARRLVTCVAGEPPGPWIEDLRRALPEFIVENWAPGAAPAEYAVVWAPPQQFIDEQQSTLHTIFNAGAGVDALLKLRIPESMKIVRLVDAGLSVQMVEYVLHALIHHFREFDSYERAYERTSWAPRAPRDRSAFPVGILGAGTLGTRVASAVAALQFPVLAWSRTKKSLEGATCFFGSSGLNDFLSSTRILVNLLPLTPDTQGILNKDSLSMLQPGAYLINAGRGAHLIEPDLIALLESGQISGATLDVFEEEPLPQSHPFWRDSRISITPHIAAQTMRVEAVQQIATAIRGSLAGGACPTGTVDRTLGY